MQWQRYSCRRGVDDVGGRGSSRESTLRSININLGRLTHKAEYSTHPQELWASCSKGRASAAAPPRINYIYLWCPGVSCYCRFFFLMCFAFMEPAILTLALTARLHPPTERCNHVNYLRCVPPAFLRPVIMIFRGLFKWSSPVNPFRAHCAVLFGNAEPRGCFLHHVFRRHETSVSLRCKWAFYS